MYLLLTLSLNHYGGWERFSKYFSIFFELVQHLSDFCPFLWILDSSVFYFSSLLPKEILTVVVVKFLISGTLKLYKEFLLMWIGIYQYLVPLKLKCKFKVFI